MNRTTNFAIGFFLCLWILTSFVSSAIAQLTVQSSPVFSSPTPSEQLVPKEKLPFKGEVIEFQKEPSEEEKVSTPHPNPLPQGEKGQILEKEEYNLEGVDIPTARYYRPWVIRRVLKPILKDDDQSFSKDELKERLKQINQFSPFKLQAAIAPGSEAGKSRLKLDVYEKQPWQITGTFDNQGRPGTGYYRGGVQVSNKSLFGMGDELNVQYVGSSHFHRLVSFYKLPVNSRGGELELRYCFQRNPYDPALYPKNVSYLEGDDNAGTITFSQPVDRNRVWTPYTSFLFRKATIIKNNTRTTALPRPFTLGLLFNKSDAWGKTRLDLQPLIIGEQWFGGNSKFYRAKAIAFRSFDLPHQNQIVFRGMWQVASNALPIAQAFQIGGESTVRGYTEGLITGDQGQVYSLEHYWPVPFLSKLIPASKDRIKGVSFVDFGQAWVMKNNARYTGNAGAFKRTSLGALGLGFRFRFTQYMQGFMDLGWGMFNRNNIELLSQPTFRIHFGIRSDFLPQKWVRARNRDYEISTNPAE